MKGFFQLCVITLAGLLFWHTYDLRLELDALNAAYQKLSLSNQELRNRLARSRQGEIETRPVNLDTTLRPEPKTNLENLLQQKVNAQTNEPSEEERKLLEIRTARERKSLESEERFDEESIITSDGNLATEFAEGLDKMQIQHANDIVRDALEQYALSRLDSRIITDNGEGAQIFLFPDLENQGDLLEYEVEQRLRTFLPDQKVEDLMLNLVYLTESFGRYKKELTYLPQPNGELRVRAKVSNDGAVVRETSSEVPYEQYLSFLEQGYRVR